MNKTILVAGGAGFIGHHLCKRLKEEGNSVIVVDNLITGAMCNVPSESQCICADVHKRESMKAVQEILDTYGRVHEIYHLASPASPTKYKQEPWVTIGSNTTGTINLLSLAEKYDAKLLFASTSEVYGDPEPAVQTEEYFGNVSTIGDRAPYDESKRL